MFPKTAELYTNKLQNSIGLVTGLFVATLFDNVVNDVLEQVEREIINSCGIGESSTAFHITARIVPYEYKQELIKLVADAVSGELIKLGYIVSIEKEYSEYTIYTLEIDWHEE